jgi:hypothetical protein
LKELMHPGYRVSRTAIPRSANDALYALGQRALKSGQAKGTFHYVHHGLRACRGQRTTTLLTAAEYTQLVYRRRRAEKGAAAKAASELEVKQRNTLLSPEEEAALTSVLAWAEAETSAEADPAAKGRKQRGIPGISPRCCTQVGLHLGRPDEATRLGLVHSDDPATPTLAVVIGLGPPEREWVPPFFVDMPAGRSYDFREPERRRAPRAAQAHLHRRRRVRRQPRGEVAVREALREQRVVAAAHDQPQRGGLRRNAGAQVPDDPLQAGEQPRRADPVPQGRGAHRAPRARVRDGCLLRLHVPAP